VRANVYVGATVTDQGIIEGCANEVQALIKVLGAEIEIWADVDVKHAAPLASRPIAELAADAVERGLASALIVSGRATGQAVEPGDLQAVKAALPSTPLYIGSGATAENFPALLQFADGAIIGTAAKVDGIVANPVDLGRVRSLRRAAG
jgi:membrane complex biogenesis BtpA family protein